MSEVYLWYVEVIYYWLIQKLLCELGHFERERKWPNSSPVIKEEHESITVHTVQMATVITVINILKSK